MSWQHYAFIKLRNGAIVLIANALGAQKGGTHG